MAYTKLNLEDGEVLTATHLAHIEDGIASAGGAIIDDTAGDGDTNVTWSADKIHDQLATKSTVSIFQNVSSGVQLAAININNVVTRIFAPDATPPTINGGTGISVATDAQTGAITISLSLSSAEAGEF